MNKEDHLELKSNGNVDLTDTDYHDNRIYKLINFNQYDIIEHTFENCEFQSCHFNEMSLAKAGFLSCKFINSEIVLTKIEQTALNTVKFIDTKIMGLNFTDCNKFGFLPEFENCLIDNTVFYINSFRKGKFINCQIRNTDFIECDMKEIDFSNSKFEKTTFKKCNLEKADFRTAINYEIDPFDNRIKKAKFSLPEAQSFLGFLGIEIK